MYQDSNHTAAGKYETIIGISPSGLPIWLIALVAAVVAVAAAGVLLAVRRVRWKKVT